MSTDKFCEMICSLQHVCFRDRTQVAKLNSRLVTQPSHQFEASVFLQGGKKVFVIDMRENGSWGREERDRLARARSVSLEYIGGGTNPMVYKEKLVTAVKGGGESCELEKPGDLG